MTREDEFFRAVAARNVVRPRVAAIVVANGSLLVQRPADDPAACYAFPGGECEVGDTMASRLCLELEQEAGARIRAARYLFVVENRFVHRGVVVHGLEHYFLVELERPDIRSREPHLELRWLPLAQLRQHDLRPHVVRDAVACGSHLHVRHLVVPLPDGSPDDAPRGR